MIDVDNEDKNHGLPDDPDEARAILDRLGIQEHTDEDCSLSRVIYSAMREQHEADVVVVSGPAVFVLNDEAVTRYQLDPGPRRRLLMRISEVAAGHDMSPFDLELVPWADRTEPQR
jgi:hypothetical protein